MIMKIYTVRDSKIETYMQPFFLQHKGAAVRSFTEAANDKSCPIGKNPEDYCLFELGVYDDQTAKFELYDQPVSMGLAVEFVKV